MKKGEKKTKKKKRDNVEVEEQKRDNRFRLDDEEIKIIQHRRETGALPSSELLKSDRSILNQDKNYRTIKKKYQEAISRNGRLEDIVSVFEEAS